MTLSEELYFEITVSGVKSELKKFIRYLTSGDLEEFFEITTDYICYDDEYDGKPDDAETNFVFTNDDLGVEIGEFDPEEFLEEFCKMSKSLDVYGHFYDINDEEYSFVCPPGDTEFTDVRKINRFNDELDEAAFNEELGEG